MPTIDAPALLELLDADAVGLGFTLRGAINALIALALFATAKGAWKGTCATFRWAWKNEPLPAPLVEEEQELTPAAEQAFAALRCPEPSYDQSAFVLACDGLVVCFANSAPHADVARLLTSCDGTPTVFGGADLKPLVTGDELSLIEQHARDLRDEVVSRDRARANRHAAEAMFKARAEAASVRNRKLAEDPIASAGLIDVVKREVGDRDTHLPAKYHPPQPARLPKKVPVICANKRA